MTSDDDGADVDDVGVEVVFKMNNDGDECECELCAFVCARNQNSLADILVTYRLHESSHGWPLYQQLYCPAFYSSVNTLPFCCTREHIVVLKCEGAVLPDLH